MQILKLIDLFLCNIVSFKLCSHSLPCSVRLISAPSPFSSFIFHVPFPLIKMFSHLLWLETSLILYTHIYTYIQIYVCWNINQNTVPTCIYLEYGILMLPTVIVVYVNVVVLGHNQHHVDFLLNITRATGVIWLLLFVTDQWCRMLIRTLLMSFHVHTYRRYTA